jgi:hypothetical protein
VNSNEAVNTHWLAFLDSGWGCTGCDWTGKLEDFWNTHERQGDGINIPF